MLKNIDAKKNVKMLCAVDALGVCRYAFALDMALDVPLCML
jgi:hypothetical protein